MRRGDVQTSGSSVGGAGGKLGATVGAVLLTGCLVVAVGLVVAWSGALLTGLTLGPWSAFGVGTLVLLAVVAVARSDSA